MGRCIAITGGTGFIGKRLVHRHLEMGDDVRLLTRSKSSYKGEDSGSVTLFEGDLSKTDVDLSGFVAGVDVLYHCAAELSDESLMRTLHVDGTRTLVNAASGKVGVWVQLSSVGVYGKRASGRIEESTEEGPVGEYEVTKAKSDRLVLDAAQNGAFACNVVRPSTVYGADMPNQSLRSWVRMLRKGMFFFIGKSGAVANYVHVDDVVDALLACGNAPSAAAGVFNVSQAFPLEAFVAAICSALDISPIQRRLPRGPVLAAASMLGWIPGFPLTRSRVEALTTRAEYQGDLICRELGFEYRISLEAGLNDLITAMGLGQ